MQKIKLNKGNLNLRFPFARPLMTSFRDVAPSFFETLYNALTPAYPVSTADLSANPAVKLSDVWVKFNLYGGVNTVTLFSDRLQFDFTGLVLGDYPIVYDVIQRVHDGVKNSFAGVQYESVETQSYIHFEMVPPADAMEYLKQYEKSQLWAFSAFGGFVEEPAARYTVRATDGSWQCTFGVTRSLQLSNGLFVDLGMTLRNQTNDVPFANTLKLGSAVGDAARKTLGLESVSDA